jgi:hypothetical protein
LTHLIQKSLKNLNYQKYRMSLSFLTFLMSLNYQKYQKNLNFLIFQMNRLILKNLMSRWIRLNRNFQRFHLIH